MELDRVNFIVGCVCALLIVAVLAGALVIGNRSADHKREVNHLSSIEACQTLAGSDAQAACIVAVGGK